MMYKKNLLRLAFFTVGLWIDCHGTVLTGLDKYNELMYNPSSGIFSISTNDQGRSQENGKGQYSKSQEDGSPASLYNPSQQGFGRLAFLIAKKTIEAFSDTGTADTILVELPVGTRFIITDGDLAPTGTFTTTEIAYAVLLATGLSGTTQISNGVIHFTGGAFTGTYNYLGTDYPGGQLAAPIEGFYATGTLVNPTLFQAAGSPTGEIPTGFPINVFLEPLVAISGTFVVHGGDYEGQIFTALSGIQIHNTVNGTLNAAGTVFAGTTIVLFGNECIGGYVSGETGHITTDTTPPNVITDFEISGSAVAAYNSLTFNGGQFITGEFVVNTLSQEFITGSFCS